jgi:hypothetical protein
MKKKRAGWMMDSYKVVLRRGGVEVLMVLLYSTGKKRNNIKMDRSQSVI